MHFPRYERRLQVHVIGATRLRAWHGLHATLSSSELPWLQETLRGCLAYHFQLLQLFRSPQLSLSSTPSATPPATLPQCAPGARSAERGPPEKRASASEIEGSTATLEADCQHMQTQNEW